LVSVYGRLADVVIEHATRVHRSQLIGHAGRSGLARNSQLYFELRLQGSPVNPKEWWDPAWYQATITEKVNAARRMVGLPVLVPMRRAGE
jgi:murein DD-endopeptidase MepM/ murein hydrolase activator NlpD